MNRMRRKFNVGSQNQQEIVDACEKKMEKRKSRMYVYECTMTRKQSNNKRSVERPIKQGKKCDNNDEY